MKKSQILSKIIQIDSTSRPKNRKNCSTLHLGVLPPSPSSPSPHPLFSTAWLVDLKRGRRVLKMSKRYKPQLPTTALKVGICAEGFCSWFSQQNPQNTSKKEVDGCWIFEMMGRLGWLMVDLFCGVGKLHFWGAWSLRPRQTWGCCESDPETVHRPGLSTGNKM